jgi:zinc transport system substrate-binding protein
MAATALSALAACGADDEAVPAAGGDATEGAGEAALHVVAGFYPLQFVVERVGGEAVVAENLTPAGAEPHDLELTGRATARLQDADLVVYLAGFSPALDEGVEVTGPDRALDVATAARLDVASDEHAEADHDHAPHLDEDAEHEHAEADHDDAPPHDEDPEHAEADHDDAAHDHEGGVDPHFWLDPTRLADVADAVAARLGELDPARAEEFTGRASTLRAELEALDAELAEGLATCARTELVTSHAAFGYLADRYGLQQVGIAGLSPQEEPSPARLGEIAEFVTEHGVSTIYYETLVDPSVAEAVATETGAAVAVLDPLEGLTDESAGRDYVEVMRANLQQLRDGLHCS